MNIAILHYHLNRGGVTQVIVNHLRALDRVADASSPWRVAILYGGRRKDWPRDLAERLPGVELLLRAVPALDYDRDEQPAASPDALASQLFTALDELGFSPEDTVVHVHNHSLGKNVVLPDALAALARAGYPLLAQIHDFAEDFRPATYRRLLQQLGNGDPRRLCAALYPQAGHIHYAVLNGRDYRILRSAGVAPDRLHALPNPVAEFPELPPKATARAKLASRLQDAQAGRFILYPVRGIRRKNLGEVILWSAMAPKRTYFAVTQPPLNPVERTRYEAWKRLAAELALPVLFEVAQWHDMTFHDHLAAADALITTSVAEGFGMVFLEAWLAGRPLIGRDLPEITADYVDAGVRLDALYPQLWIPLDWVGKEAFFQTLQTAYRKVLVDFGQPPPAEDQLRRDIESLIVDDSVDFASLTPAIQQQIVRGLVERAERRAALLERNPRMAQSLRMIEADLSDRVAANAQAVRAGFSLASSGRKLRRLYETACASTRTDRLAAPEGGMNVLRSFLQVSRLQPLRCEP